MSHWTQYRDLSLLVLRHARGDWLRGTGLEEAFSAEREAAEPADVEDAEALAADLVALGPTYVKFGQLLSTRADLLPDEYIQALSNLQDAVSPLPVEVIEKVFEEEIGIEISEAFSEFESEPLGCASLAQVHTARLRNGRAVVVKVQRPDIHGRIREDFEALEAFAELLERHSKAARRLGPTTTIQEMRRSIFQELDYRLEARNLSAIRQDLAEYERILIPEPVPKLSGRRVLTMDLIPGRKATAIGRLGLLEIDGPGLVKELFEAYLDQILVHGLLNADPHPGNVLVTDDGRIGLIDFGMVARVPEPDRERLLRLLLAVIEGRSDEVARVARDLGEVGEGWDPAGFRSAVADLVHRVAGASAKEMDVGRSMVELLRICSSHGLTPPPHLCLVVKALLNLDAVAQALDPAFDPNAVMEEHTNALLRKHSLGFLRPSRAFGAMLETQRLVSELPGRLDRFTQTLAEGRFSVHVDAIDERALLQGIEKVANRIAIGVILAALILGASLLMRVETGGPMLWGYPALALVFFVVAALGGFGLVVRMALSDPGRSRDGPKAN